MKKLILAVLVVMLFALCSCNYALMSMNNRGKDYINHSYLRLGGEKTYSVTVDEDTIFTIESTVEDGSISVSVVNDEKEKVFESGLSTETYTFNAENGRYVFKITADDASGEYKIMWKPK